VIKEKSWLPE